MNGRVISVQAFKGGVGKTTIATNLASAFSLKKNNDVLLIDADSQANTLTAFGVKNSEVNFTLQDVLLGQTNISEAIVKIKDNLTLLAPGDELSEIQGELLKNDIDISSIELFTNLIDQLKRYFTHIVIDTSPSLGFVNEGIIASADTIIVPFEPEPFSSKSLIALSNKIKVVKSSPKTKNTSVDVKYVISKFDVRRNVDKKFKEDFTDFCNDEKLNLLKTIIKLRTIYSKSIMEYRKPAVLSLSNSLLNKNCIFNLSKEV